MFAMYLTIWLALTLFAAGEAGRSLSPPGVRPPRWARQAFTAGLVLAIVHTMLAFDIVHAWSHADAVRNTARQTSAVYGIAFGSGVYVNYLFFAVWLVDAVRWRRSGWVLRAFYFVIIVNAAVIFAAGSRRILGGLLIAALVGVWVRPCFEAQKK